MTAETSSRLLTPPPLTPATDHRFRRRGWGVNATAWQRAQIRRWFVGAVLLGSSLLIGAMAIGSYQIVRSLVLENLKRQVFVDIQQSSHDLDRWLASRKAEITTLANTPDVKSGDWAQVEPYLRSEAARLWEYHLLMMVNPDGSYYTHKEGLAKANLRDREWFQKAMNGQTGVFDPIVSRSTGVLQINVVASITNTGNPRSTGLLAGAIPVDRLSQVVNRLNYGAGSYAFALNSRGVPIVHPDPHRIDRPEKHAPSLLDSSNRELAALAQKMVASASADRRSVGIERVFLDGSWKYIAYVPLREAPWTIGLVIPQENVESPLAALNLLAIVIGLLLLLALAGVWRQVRTYERTRARAERESLLNRLTSRIRESLDLSVILQTTVTELAMLMTLDRVLFGWYKPETETFEIVADSAVSGSTDQPLPQFAVSEELNQRLRAGETVQLPSIQPTHLALPLQAGAYLTLEIPSQDGHVGYLLGLHDHRLSRGERELLVAVTDQLAIAVTQAHLYTQTQQQVTLLNDTLTELSQTQLHLVQSEKMSSLGQLVAGIAHEINNPVNFINGNILHVTQYTQDLLSLLQLYQDAYPQVPAEIQNRIDDIDLDFIGEDLPKLLMSMQFGSQRIREIVQSLRIFSRLDEAEVKDVNIHEGIDSTLMILHNRLKPKSTAAGIRVIKEYGTLPLVECYAGQLNQVFMNILSNAIDALETDERERSEIAEPPTIWIRTEAKEGCVCIRIADNGPGIPEAVQSRLFDPFFTTKPVGKGTGLGLAISYKIVVERHQGRLFCHSQPGHSTEFTVEIPVQQHAAELASPA